MSIKAASLLETTDTVHILQTVDRRSVYQNCVVMYLAHLLIVVESLGDIRTSRRHCACQPFGAHLIRSFYSCTGTGILAHNHVAVKKSAVKDSSALWKSSRPLSTSKFSLRRLFRCYNDSGRDFF